MTDQFMLSTIDNPFNPFVDFDSWKNFDEDQGYNTCEYLSLNSDELSFEFSDSQNQKTGTPYFLHTASASGCCFMEQAALYRPLSRGLDFHGDIRSVS